MQGTVWKSAGLLLGTLVLLWAGLAPAASAGESPYVESRFTIPWVDPPIEAFPYCSSFADVMYPLVGGDSVLYYVTDDDGSAWLYCWNGASQEQWPLVQPPADYPRRLVTDFSGELCVCVGSDGVTVSDGQRIAVIRPGSRRTLDMVCLKGDTVVWSEKQKGNWNIVAATIDVSSLAVTRTFTICRARGSQMLSGIAGDWIVWVDRRHDKGDIYAFNLRTHKTKAICAKRGEQTLPKTDGSWVAWVDYRTPGHAGDIYARRLSGGREVAVCTNPKAQDEVAVGDGFIVWTDWRRDALKSAHDPSEPRVPIVDVRGWDSVRKRSFLVDAPRPHGWYNSELDMEGDSLVYVTRSTEHMDTPYAGSVCGVVLRHP